MFVTNHHNICGGNLLWDEVFEKPAGGATSSYSRPARAQESPGHVTRFARACRT